MRKIGYLLWQAVQSKIYYKKRYALYIVSFYIGLLLPVLCIANYSYIRSQLHYYWFDGIEQSVILDWQSYSCDAADLDMPVEHTVSAFCTETFLNWDSRPMAIKGIGKDDYYDLPPIEGRMFTEAEMEQGRNVCILDIETSQKYDCGLQDTVEIRGIDFTVVGINTDSMLRSWIIIPFSAMREAYGDQDTYIQFKGTFILDEDQDKDQFLLEVEDSVRGKDPQAKILFSEMGDQKYKGILQSLEKWKLLRGAAAFGAALFFLLNELVIITGKVQKDRRTIAVKMALGASRHTVVFSSLVETAIITLIADILIFLSIQLLAEAFGLEGIILTGPFVIVVSLVGSMGITVIITLAALWGLRNDAISALMRSEDV